MVTTCNLEEKGTRKCEQFWPDASNDRIVVVSVTEMTPGLVMRRFKIDQLDVTQLHYVGWPDHGVPSG